QDVGQPGIAAATYRGLLASPAGPGVDRTQLVLLLAGTLLDADDIPGADAALQMEPAESRRGQWHLRAGLVAAYQKKWDVARGELALIPNNGADLPNTEKSWFYYLNGMIVDAGKETGRANDFYDRAIEAATNDYAKARFTISRHEADLRRGDITDEAIAA